MNAAARRKKQRALAAHTFPDDTHTAILHHLSVGMRLSSHQKVACAHHARSAIPFNTSAWRWRLITNFYSASQAKVDFCTLRFAKSTAFEYVMRGASLVCVVCVVYERAGEPESNYGAINRFTRVYRDASGSNNYRSAHVCSQTLVGCARAPRADTTSTACTHSSTLTGWGKATN